MREQDAPADPGGRVGQELDGRPVNAGFRREHDQFIRPQAGSARAIQQAQRGWFHPERVGIVQRRDHADHARGDGPAGRVAAAARAGLIHALIEHEQGVQIQVDLVSNVQPDRDFEIRAGFGWFLGQTAINHAHAVFPAFVIAYARADADQRSRVAFFGHERDPHRFGFAKKHDLIHPMRDDAQIRAGAIAGECRSVGGFDGQFTVPLAGAQADAGRDMHIPGRFLGQPLSHPHLRDGGRIQRHQRADRGREDGTGNNGEQGTPLGDQPGDGQMDGEPDRRPGEFAQTPHKAPGPARVLTATLHTDPFMIRPGWITLYLIRGQRAVRSPAGRQTGPLF